jgi:hypothetical protein
MGDTMEDWPLSPSSPALPLDRSHHSPFRRHLFTLLLALLSAITLSATVFFAYNSSLENPFSARLIFEKPERSIFVLIALTQITIFFLYELTSTVFDTLRWVFACGDSGISAPTFLVMGRATSIIGVLFLILRKGAKPRRIQRDGHKLWGCQKYVRKADNTKNRLFFLFLRGGLGVLLLADISFKSTYHTVYQLPVEHAGLSLLNTSVSMSPYFNQKATSVFWWFFPSLLTDSQNAKSVASLNCSGTPCTSYFLPGLLSTIAYNLSQPSITSGSFPEAVSFIQNDAPGYQLDFVPINIETDPPMTSDDCQVYGISSLAVQICLKKADTSFMAGMSPTETITYTSVECMSYECVSN